MNRERVTIRPTVTMRNATGENTVHHRCQNVTQAWCSSTRRRSRYTTCDVSAATSQFQPSTQPILLRQVTTAMASGEPQPAPEIIPLHV